MVRHPEYVSHYYIQRGSARGLDKGKFHAYHFVVKMAGVLIRARDKELAILWGFKTFYLVVWCFNFLFPFFGSWSEKSSLLHVLSSPNKNTFKTPRYWPWMFSLIREVLKHWHKFSVHVVNIVRLLRRRSLSAGQEHSGVLFKVCLTFEVFRFFHIYLLNMW